MQEELSSTQQTTNGRIWLAHLRAWQKSGLTRAEYCRQHALSYHAFIYWKKKADRQQNSAIDFVQVPAIRTAQAAAHKHTTALRVDLGNSLKIEVHDGFTPTTLSQVVKTLRGC